MMYVIPDSVATKQLSGGTETPSRLSPSKPSPCRAYQSPADASKSPYSNSPASHRRRYYSSDEEDDSRDRQSHWKRTKVRTDDSNRGSSRNRITYTESDRHSYVTSPSLSRLNPPPQSVNSHSEPRVIVLHEKDEGSRRSSYESESRIRGSGSKGWDAAVRPFRDGGTAFEDIDPAGTKRKYASEVRKSSLMMCERSIVVKDKHMARRVPAERSLEGGYEFRVNGREEGEVGEFNDEGNSSLFLEDSREVDYEDRARARIGLDLREALNRRSQGLDTMSRESRVYGDQKTGATVRVRKVEFDLCCGNGKGSLSSLQGSGVKKVLDLGRSSSSGNDESNGSASLGGIGRSAAAVGAQVERDMELERREKRERWAEKERDLETELQDKLQKDLEKENMPETQPKSVTVVDYSHKFTVAKASISEWFFLRPILQLSGRNFRLSSLFRVCLQKGVTTLGFEYHITDGGVHAYT